MKNYKILVINPGSTSTKLSLFIGKKCQFTESVFHDSSVLEKFPTINDQLDYRMSVVDKFLRKHQIDLSDVDAIVGRGGGCYSVPSGIYAIDDQLIEDTREMKGGLYHSSMLGVQMAKRMHDRFGGIMLMMDPPVVDELSDLARLTGVKGIYRKAVSHALNTKATICYHCAKHNLKYEDHNFIVAHIDGGISITAHDHGQMVDGNDAGGGEGPFTPTRMGSLAVTDGLNYLKNISDDEIRELCSVTGGLSSYFGTSDADKIHALVAADNKKATLIWQAMIYQIAKWIGMMAAVLKGNVDGIVLTGGLCRFDDIVQGIRSYCGWIAEIYAYPGELEQEAMARGALAVMEGKSKPKKYPGKPVFDGFHI